jgi:hypothetical protein
MKYRKLPVTIEAIQYRGDENYEEICEFVGTDLVMEYVDSEQIIIVPTLEGELRADKGDWIIKGVQGEFYPCKPDIFKETYEKVE